MTCVMAGDNQMDPAELEGLVGRSRAARSTTRRRTASSAGEAWTLIPRTRYLGNAVLSLLTKIASGYWHVADSQAGYTAISRAALELLDLDRIYPRYGFPNDMLVHLNVWNARVRDVAVAADLRRRRAVRDPHAHGSSPRISWLLFKGFLWRLRRST